MRRELVDGAKGGATLRRVAPPHFSPDEREGDVVLQIPTVTSEEFEELDVSAAVALLHARYRTLADAGFDCDEALVVAVHPELDLGEVIALLDRGCPVRTVLRILL